MRRLVDGDRIRRFMKTLGQVAEKDVRLYFTGGATAVLVGWRSSTVDIDIKMEPERDELFRALPKLKDQLEVNVELASPDGFIPPVPGWQERSTFIGREGRLSFYHYDFYSQVLSKIERGHAKDREDIQEMLGRGLVDPKELLRRFEQIEPSLHLYPAIDPPTFRRAVEEVVRASQGTSL